MKGRFPKPCLVCGALTDGETRCQRHQAEYLQNNERKLARKIKKARLYGGRYNTQARAIRATAKLCYLCGGAPSLTDPIEADHLYPSLGGASPLAPAHRSCNSRKGNRDVSDLDPAEWPGLGNNPPAGKLGG